MFFSLTKILLVVVLLRVQANALLARVGCQLRLGKVVVPGDELRRVAALRSFAVLLRRLAFAGSLPSAVAAHA